MRWSIADVENKLLTGKIASVALTPATILDAVNRVQEELGSEWIGSRASAKGLATTMDIIGTGLRLACLTGVLNGNKLVDQIRRNESSADAELTAIYLFRSHEPGAEMELYPEVGTRRPDFRVRRDSDVWTTVEVTQALASREEERIRGILRRITDALQEMEVRFVLEIQFCREPTNAEIEILCAQLPEFCRLPGQQSAKLVEGLGYLFRDEIEIGRLRFHEIPELADTPMTGLAMFQGGGPGGGPHHQVAVRMPFSDKRAKRFLNDESKQLPKGGPGIVMISGPSSKNEITVWDGLIQRCFQPTRHTRVSGVCLFGGGMTPRGSQYDWILRTHWIENCHAARPVNDWVRAAIEARRGEL